MGGHCTPPAISRGRGVGGHCLSPPPVGDAEWGGGGHCAFPTVLVGDAEWGGGALHIPYSTSRGSGVGGGGGTPRPLLLAGVNYKIM